MVNSNKMFAVWERQLSGPSPLVFITCSILFMLKESGIIHLISLISYTHKLLHIIANIMYCRINYFIYYTSQYFRIIQLINISFISEALMEKNYNIPYQSIELVHYFRLEWTIDPVIHILAIRKDMFFPEVSVSKLTFNK